MRIRSLSTTTIALALALAFGNPVVPAASAELPTVALAGDIACATYDGSWNGGYGTGERCRQKSVSDLLVPSRITKLITLGDNQYENGSYDQFTRSYAKSYGRVKSKTLPTCGNHEYRTGSGSGHQQYFGRSCKWYTTKVSTARFIMLDTNRSMAVGSEQYNFVRDTLNWSGSTCIFLVGHHPRYSVGSHGNTSAVDPIWDLGVSKGATAMFSGHDHAGMRYKPRNRYDQNVGIKDGMVQIVSGAGGKNIYPQANTSSGLEKFIGKLGFYEMAIGSTSVTIRYRSRLNSVLDTVTLPCRRSL